MQFFREFFAEPLRRVEEERRDYLKTLPAGRIDLQVPLVLVATALLMTFRDDSYTISFYEMAEWIDSLGNSSSAARDFYALITDRLNVGLAGRAYWAIRQCLVFVVLPVFIVKVVLRRPLSDYGLKLRGMTSCWWVYLAMYLVMAPAVLVISTTESFQHTYPFLKVTPFLIASSDGAGREIATSYWPRFWIWQAFYAVQFVSLEFFFRGFMVHALRRQLGVYAIFVMTIPYCMIHFGKPLPETLGAIGAGVILGFMSLKTRSIWLGAALHIGVALTMDLAALAQR